MRKIYLSNDNYYHIYSRSIAKYIIFNNAEEYSRILDIINLCRYLNFNYRYSQFNKLELQTKNDIIDDLKKKSPLLVEIVAYCLMPTHIHLVLKQISETGISKYIAKILNSYTRYFNIKHKRSGPLWTGRFSSVQISNDEQLLHLTRYIHLNPTSAGLIKSPNDWNYSSYHEYIGKADDNNKICNFKDLFDLSPQEYKKFVLDRKSYQQELSIIKNMLIDDYTG